MRLSHLTDSEIQSWLDRKKTVPPFQSQLSNHLACCDICAGEVAEYEKLYSELSLIETEEFPEKLSNQIMVALPRPVGEELWRVTFGWATRLLSALLFFGVLFVPFDIALPTFFYSTFFTWSTVSVLPVISSIMKISEGLIAAEHLPMYLFALLAGLIMFNIERIYIGLRRQRI